MASLPRISKNLGSKHCIKASLTLKAGNVGGCQRWTQPCLVPSSLPCQLSGEAPHLTPSSRLPQWVKEQKATLEHPFSPGWTAGKLKWSEMTSAFHRSTWHLRGFGILFGLQRLPNCFTLQPSKLLMSIKWTSQNLFPWVSEEGNSLKILWK